jgi:hypothetical protein
VAVVTDAARLPAAWQELHRGLVRGGGAADRLAAVTATVDTTTAGGA